MSNATDRYKISGWIDIDHDSFECECDRPFSRSELIVKIVHAHSEEEAIHQALTSFREQDEVTTDACTVGFRSQLPKVVNESLREREMKALAEWNNGKPIACSCR